MRSCCANANYTFQNLYETLIVMVFCCTTNLVGPLFCVTGA